MTRINVNKSWNWIQAINMNGFNAIALTAENFFMNAHGIGPTWLCKEFSNHIKITFLFSVSSIFWIFFRQFYFFLILNHRTMNSLNIILLVSIPPAGLSREITFNSYFPWYFKNSKWYNIRFAMLNEWFALVIFQSLDKQNHHAILIYLCVSSKFDLLQQFIKACIKIIGNSAMMKGGWRW